MGRLATLKLLAAALVVMLALPTEAVLFAQIGRASRRGGYQSGINKREQDCMSTCITECENYTNANISHCVDKCRQHKMYKEFGLGGGFQAAFYCVDNKQFVDSVYFRK